LGDYVGHHKLLFFEDKRGCTITGTLELFVAIIERVFTPEMQNFPRHNTRTWFQQDDKAMAHASNVIYMPIVNSVSPNNVIFQRVKIA